uniref:Uncharacterized protein n=1 Tax=Arundo donax TaxID=35708 RepID=A0A0A9BF15_ARUDO
MHPAMRLAISNTLEWTHLWAMWRISRN